MESQKNEKKGRPALENPLRLTARHFPSLIEGYSVEGTSERTERRRCHVCSNTTIAQKKDTKTRYECVQCNIGLCVVPCFELYHTLKNF